MTMIVTDQRRNNGVEVTVSVIFTVLTIGYMLPWLVAASRGKSNSLAVGLLTFFLGWTMIGWVVALVMACGAHQAVGFGNAMPAMGYAPQPHLPYGGHQGQPQAMPYTQPMQLPPGQ